MAKLRIQNDYLREFMAECLGTCLFVCLGCSSNAVSLFTNAPMISAGVAWGLALTVSIYVSGGVSGGHLNPAVSLGLASINKFNWRKLLHYFAAQYLGAFLGALITYAVYNQSIDKLPRSTTMGIFGTFSKDHVNFGSAFLDQLVSTAFFLLVICAVTDEHNGMINQSKGLIPLMIGFADLGVMVLAFGYNCGGAMNPARDLMPRIMTAMLGWKGEPFKHRDGYFLAPLIACHLGGVLGCWIYKLMISAHWKK